MGPRSASTAASASRPNDADTEELAGKDRGNAIRNLLAELIADAPYAVTHGSFRPVYDSRATRRMGRSTA